MKTSDLLGRRLADLSGRSLHFADFRWKRSIRIAPSPTKCKNTLEEGERERESLFPACHSEKDSFFEPQISPLCLRPPSTLAGGRGFRPLVMQMDPLLPSPFPRQRSAQRGAPFEAASRLQRIAHGHLLEWSYTPPLASSGRATTLHATAGAFGGGRKRGKYDPQYVRALAAPPYLTRAPLPRYMSTTSFACCTHSWVSSSALDP